jgi:hypothetical protein
MLKLKQPLVMLLFICSLFALPFLAYAATDSDNTVVNSSLGSTISMSTDGTVNVNLTPTASGSMSSDSDTVLVSTNNTSGYTLTLSDANTNTNLINGSNNILADSGTQASPSNSLTNNRWGYRVDSIGGFGAGPTSAESNVGSSSYKWAGVPSSAAPNTIKTTSSTATDDSTTVWFGVKADTSNPNGTYTDTVTYTATTN